MFTTPLTKQSVTEKPERSNNPNGIYIATMVGEIHRMIYKTWYHVQRPNEDGGVVNIRMELAATC